MVSECSLGTITQMFVSEIYCTNGIRFSNMAVTCWFTEGRNGVYFYSLSRSHCIHFEIGQSCEWTVGKGKAECKVQQNKEIVSYTISLESVADAVYWLCASRTSIGVNTFMMLWAELWALALGRALHKVFLGFFKIVRVLSDDERSSSFSLGLLNFI